MRIRTVRACISSVRGTPCSAPPSATSLPMEQRITEGWLRSRGTLEVRTSRYSASQSRELS